MAILLKHVSPKYVFLDQYFSVGASALQAAIAAVSKYGGASAGYRTLLDALIPAAEILQEVDCVFNLCTLKIKVSFVLLLNLYSIPSHRD